MLDFEKAMKKLVVAIIIFSIGGVVGYYEGMVKVMEIYPSKIIDLETTVPGQLIGDVNCDGLIDACDASYVMEYYSAMSTDGELHLQMDYDIADVNRDGLIDVCDSSAILAYYSELMTGNATPLWPFEKSTDDLPLSTQVWTTD